MLIYSICIRAFRIDILFEDNIEDKISREYFCIFKFAIHRQFRMFLFFFFRLILLKWVPFNEFGRCSVKFSSLILSLCYTCIPNEFIQIVLKNYKYECNVSDWPELHCFISFCSIA